MSLHAELSPEVQAKLAAQKRNSTITAMIIALLVVFLLGLILFIIALTSVIKVTPEIISYSSSSQDEEKIEKPEMTNQVERKPSAPSSSMAKVIAANTASPTAVPVPDVEVTEPSLTFGNGDDFGDGWGSGSGNGSGAGGSGASFFKQKVTAERICFVIDYSASMRGDRINLLKKELARSVGALPDGMEYQLIFFAGPAWVAGSDVQLQGKGSATVEYEGKTYKWTCTGKNANKWDTKGSTMRVQWRKADKERLEESLSAIKSTSLVWGTAWEKPLEMAIDMKPRPDVVFFMTDGASGSDSEDIAKRIGRRAKSRGITINSIALMDPTARDAMGALSERTGGQFSMVKKDGSTQVLIEAKEKK